MLRALFLASLITSLPLAAQSAPKDLHDGEQVTLTGTLKTRERNGYQHYLVMVLSQRVRVMFDNPKLMREIEIILPGQNEALSRHAGETLTATGEMMINDVSPYYWNGAMVMATEVKLSNGSVIVQSFREEGIPDSIQRYESTVTLMPKGPRRYSTRLIGSKMVLGLQDYSGCSLNGSGEVLNCSCTSGFEAIRGHSRLEPNVPERSGWGFIQMRLPDRQTAPFTVTIECARKASKD